MAAALWAQMRDENLVQNSSHRVKWWGLVWKDAANDGDGVVSIHVFVWYIDQLLNGFGGIHVGGSIGPDSDSIRILHLDFGFDPGFAGV